MRLRVLTMAALLAAVAAGCGGDDEGSGASPRLEGPASRYAPGIDELPGVFDVLPVETYAVTDEVWAREGLFASGADGEAFAEEHGFRDGWRVLYTPDGLLAGVASQGQYYATIETYLFETAAGATATYERYTSSYGDIAGSDELEDVDRVGNRSSAWSFVEGILPSTELVAIYHRLVFQRGNLLAIVQTYGAESLMTIDAAREIAMLVDNRALGTTEAIEPTPITPLLPTPPGG